MVKQLIQLRYFILALMALGRVAGVEAVFCVDFEDRTNEICRKIKCGICKENKDQYHALWPENRRKGVPVKGWARQGRGMLGEWALPSGDQV